MADAGQILTGAAQTGLGAFMTNTFNPVVAGASGALGFLSSLGSLFGGSSDIKDQYTYWKYAYERQRKGNMEDWMTQTNYINEYNSPEKTMERLLAAGMNPNLAYQNAQGWHSTQGASPASPGGFNFSSTLGNKAQMLQQMLNSAKLMSDIRLTDSQARKNNAEADDKEREVQAKDYYTIWSEMPRAQAKREISQANLNDTDSTVHKAMQELQDEIFTYTKEIDKQRLQFEVDKWNDDKKIRMRALDIDEWYKHQEVQLMQARLSLDERIGKTVMAQNMAAAGMLYELGVLHHVTGEGVSINNQLIGQMLGEVPDAVLTQFGLNRKDMWAKGQTRVTWNELTNRLQLLGKLKGNEGISLSNDFQAFINGLQEWRYGEPGKFDDNTFIQGLSRVLLVLGLNGNSIINMAKVAK